MWGNIAMKPHTILFLIIFLFIFSACEDTPVDADGLYFVKGKVVYKNAGVSQVPVSLSNETSKFLTTTDGNGYFILEDVPVGTYILTVQKAIDDQSFVENNIEVTVSGNTELDALLLPDPVVLYHPDIVTISAVELRWSSSMVQNFMEYKIYRHHSSALDETTGTLIHIATSRNDTTYTDTGLEEFGGLGRNATWYYRIYIMNQYGRLGGSNILQITTPEWENEDNFTVSYTLERDIQFTSQHGTVAGIDHDGENFWVVYLNEQGGYHDPNKVTIEKQNFYSGKSLKLFEYEEQYAFPSGLAYDGSSLWLNNYGSGQDISTLRKINTDTGEVELSYTLPYGIQDIAFDGNTLLLSYYYDRVERFNQENGAILNEYFSPFGSGANFGITSRNKEIWVTSKSSRYIAILNDQGEHIGVASNDILEDWNGYSSRLHLSSFEDKIILVKESRIYILHVDEDLH